MATIPTMTYRTKLGETITIRCAADWDAESLLSLGRDVMAENIYSLTMADELNLTTEEEVAWIRQHKDHQAKLLLVAEKTGRLVGSLDFSCGHRKRIAHTGEFGMSVAATDREQGIGSALLRTLIKWAEGHATLEKISLRVHATNDRALSLYRSVGFREEGRAVRELKYGPGTYVDSIIMARFVKI